MIWASYFKLVNTAGAQMEVAILHNAEELTRMLYLAAFAEPW